ncbi:hypothetical protein EB796_004528 [Bugula neritina]|uniref:Secreted protein n=1 Tax=Bugula neritina TaxID=10212 RepID=A0A7J7KET6_BUGNE|nr:hypothetical protein EB796_004528 [Bugula neritina]
MGWCLFFGFGSLLWCQVITSLPIKKLPRCFTVGREVREKDLEVQSSILLSLMEQHGLERRCQPEVRFCGSAASADFSSRYSSPSVLLQNTEYNFFSFKFKIFCIIF